MLYRSVTSSRRSMKSADQSVLGSLDKPTNSTAVSSPSHTHTPAVSSLHCISVLDRNVATVRYTHSINLCFLFSAARRVHRTWRSAASSRHCSFLLHHTGDNSNKYRSRCASMQQASPNVVSSPERNKDSYKVS